MQHAVCHRNLQIVAPAALSISFSMLARLRIRKRAFTVKIGAASKDQAAAKILIKPAHLVDAVDADEERALRAAGKDTNEK